MRKQLLSDISKDDIITTKQTLSKIQSNIINIKSTLHWIDEKQEYLSNLNDIIQKLKLLIQTDEQS